MSLFDLKPLVMPRLLFNKPNVSSGAKFLYMLLYDSYGSVGYFGTFCPSDFVWFMNCSIRTLYRYWKELVDTGCIYEEKGWFKFYYE